MEQGRVSSCGQGVKLLMPRALYEAGTCSDQQSFLEFSTCSFNQDFAEALLREFSGEVGGSRFRASLAAWSA